jgi:hypothetical protein
MLAVGTVLMVTARDDVAVQPLASVTVTVYVPEVVNVLFADVVLVPPLQAKLVPPLAVRLTLLHAVAVPEMEAVALLTVTTRDDVAVQPLSSVTVTV